MTSVGPFGFIGLGDMGLPMARRLLAAGLEVVAWNRSAGPLETLRAEGARAAASPAEVGAHCDLIGLCLTSHAAVEVVISGPSGVLAGVAGRSGACIADFSTGAPAAARAFAALAAADGVGWIDAPVSGGVRGATEGTLVVFAGGAPEHLASLGPLLDPLASRVTRLGGPGAGQAAKICNQMIVASNLLTIAETLALAGRAGIDAEALPGAFAGGFADSAPLQIFGPRMAARRFEPRLGAIGLMAKDVGLARALAAQAGATTPLLDLCAQIFARAPDAGVPSDADLSRLIALFDGAGD